MKKNGFTLAEILISLGIIGVIAALTIPNLVSSTQKDQAGASLGKAVEQFELGCQNMIQIANTNILDPTYGDTLGAFIVKDLFPDTASNQNDPLPQHFATKGAAFMGLQKLSLTSTELTELYGKIKLYDGTAATDQVNKIKTASRYKFTKFPVTAYITPDSSSDWTKPEDIVAEIRIDTNGTDAPNTFGKDLFVFKINNSCKMIPQGFEPAAGSGLAKYKVNCTDTNITDGLDCAARVVTDGFKINY